MKQKIAIIGGGSWGTALAMQLNKNKHDVAIWLRNEETVKEILKTRTNNKYLPNIKIPDEIKVSNNISEVINNKNILVLAVPTQVIRETLDNIKEFIKNDQIIVNVAKGIENGTLQRVSEIVKEVLPEVEYSILSGPSHAEEVARDIPTAVIAAAEKKEIAEYIQETFMTPTFRVYTNLDVVGVELGGALKNVVALGAGISDGLKYGDNTKAALMNRGIIEISRLGQTMGAKKLTFTGLSGIGDLIVTCTSMHSRNRRAGIKIGEGNTVDEATKSVGMVVEGIKTAKSAYELAKKYNVSMPIIEEMYQVLYENKSARKSVMDLMQRDKTDELQSIKSTYH